MGSFFEGVAAPQFGTPLLDTMLLRDDVRAITVGHDHVNDWCGKWRNDDTNPRAGGWTGRWSSWG